MKYDKKINIFAVDKIITIGKVFGMEGYELESLFIKDSDLSFKNKELDIHGSDISSGTIAFVTLEGADKYHRLWFKLEGYEWNKFESWKLVKESIEYNESEG
tara:strand:+ start:311 stop:616 length:306 start_codon:yes stop_codon:yes gene_type:complete